MISFVLLDNQNEERIFSTSFTFKDTRLLIFVYAEEHEKEKTIALQINYDFESEKVIKSHNIIEVPKQNFKFDFPKLQIDFNLENYLLSLKFSGEYALSGSFTIEKIE